jgi:hypothetical protein
MSMHLVAKKLYISTSSRTGGACLEAAHVWPALHIKSKKQNGVLALCRACLGLMPRGIRGTNRGRLSKKRSDKRHYSKTTKKQAFDVPAWIAKT